MISSMLGEISLVVPTINKPSTRQVETILVCTGVYQKQNDLLYHLRNLFKENEKGDKSDANSTVGDSSSSINKKNDQSNSNLLDIDRNELRLALSRKNSFICYFENKLNIPDATVDNLKDAVDYILKFKEDL